MMKKIAILLCVLLLAPVLVLPGVAAGSTQYFAAICPQITSTVGDFVEDPDPTHDPAHTIYVQEVGVEFKNWGPIHAYNVRVAISYEPVGTTALDPEKDVELVLGDMLVQSTATISIILRTDVDLVKDANDNIRWTIKYYDADGIQWKALNVPYECGPEDFPTPQEYPSSPPTLSMDIKRMTIKWADDGASFRRWRSLDKDIFSIWGRLELPDGYTLADLEKQATAGIAIGGGEGSDMVELRERDLRWLPGVLWAYRGNEQSGDGMNITNMVIWWADEGSQWAGHAGFYIRGVLELDSVGVDTEPVATVTLAIPVVGDGSLEGEENVEFRVYPRLRLWSYSARLPRFPCDPSGTE